MRRFRTFAFVALAVAGAVSIERYSSVSGQQQVGAERATVFEGARLIVGNASAPIERSAFVIQGQRITAGGPAGGSQNPAGGPPGDPAPASPRAGGCEYRTPPACLA